MEKEILIGRDQKKCHLLLPNNEPSRLSRLHAIVKLDYNGQLWITDCSSNGTFINGIRLIHGKPYLLNVNDNVFFANEHQLDWNKLKPLLPVPPPPQSPPQPMYAPVNPRPDMRPKTNVHREAGRLFLSIIEWQERITLLQLFWRALTNPSKRLYDYYNSISYSPQFSPSGAYLFSFTILFIAHKIANIDLLPPGVPEELEDFFPAIYGAFLVIAGYISYLFFRWQTKTNVHPRQYFYPYIALSAINNIFSGILVALLPLFVGDLEIFIGILVLIFYGWIIYHSINLQALTWQISFRNAIAYNIFLAVIVFVFVFAFTYLVALLIMG